MLMTVLIVILILALVGGVTPYGNYATRGPYWGTGWFGGGGIGLVLLIVLILILAGHRI